MATYNINDLEYSRKGDVQGGKIPITNPNSGMRVTKDAGSSGNKQSVYNVPGFVPTLTPIKIDYRDTDSDNPTKIAKYNALNQATYANASNMIAYDQALQERAYDQIQASTIKRIKDETASEQYKLMMQNRDIQIDSQLSAFKRNNQNVAQQLELNRLAAERASGQAEAILADRIKNESFKLERESNSYLQSLAQSQYEAANAVRESEKAAKNFQIAEALNAFETGQSIRAYDFQEQQTKEAFLEQQAKAEDARAQILRNFNEAASASQFKYDLAGQSFDQYRTSAEFERGSLSRDIDRKESLKVYEQDSIQDQRIERIASGQFERQGFKREFERFQTNNADQALQLRNRLSRFVSESDFNKQSLKREFDQSKTATQFEQESLDRELQRNESQLDYDQTINQKELEQFQTAKAYEKAVALDNFETQRAEKFNEIETRMFQRTQQIGQQLARGQRGQSAMRGMQSISAMSGIDLGRMYGQIDRAFDTYNLRSNRISQEVLEEQEISGIRNRRLGERRSEITKETKAKKQRLTQRQRERRDTLKANIGRENQKQREQSLETRQRLGRLDEILDEQSQEVAAQIDRSRATQKYDRDTLQKKSDRLQVAFEQDTEEFLAKRARSKEMQVEKRESRNLEQNRLQEQLDEEQDAARDNWNVSILGEQRAYDRMKTSTARSKALRAEARVGQSIKSAINELEIGDNKDQADLRLNLISQTTGLKAEVFSMDRRAIGESMMSALSAFESQKEDIYLRKYEADVKAYASRMFEPKFADAPKKPFETPQFDNPPPARPIEVPPAGVARPQSPPQQSSFSKILQIGATVLGAVAAPFTAGGSVAAAAALTGGAAVLGTTSAFV